MSLRFCVLASGSKGNATYVECPGGGLLVDAGISARQIILRMEARGLDPGEIQGIFITHEHNDHCRGVRVLAKRLGVPVITTEETWRAMGDLGATALEALPAGGSVDVCGLHVQSFLLPHDAAEPVGLVVSHGGMKLGLCTDLGQPTLLAHTRLSGCHGLVLEANHDPGMLAQGPYPVWLKQRVASTQGHLSNRQSAQFLAKLAHGHLQTVVLAHISETNNFAELALREARAALEAVGLRADLHAAAQDQPGQVHELSPRPPAVPPGAH